MDGVIDTVKAHLQERLAPIDARFAEMEKHIREIPRGPKGDGGDKGEPGASVDMAAIEGMVNLKVAAAVAALPRGLDGESVHPDTVALMVRDALAAAIKDLPAPKNGEPGKDAAHIEPLMAIDPEKSYPRGTWAAHQNGLWLARRNTQGMDGWEIIVAGVQSIEAEQTDEREFTFTALMSGGEKRAQKFNLPVVIDRGVWKEGKYSQGDVVTYGGSSWHAERDTDQRPGTLGADTGWRLMVKCGRDGKDFTPGNKGPSGPVKV